MSSQAWLLYGANGYTGELIAREAVRRGQRPVLGGRTAAAVGGLAAELGLEHRVFSLDTAKDVDAGLVGMGAVLHCAGPFSRTARPMAEACLRTRTHYLDITGEVVVFESLAARDAPAREAGIVLLPGAGFDVVPSDCLAAHLKRRLPSATHLALAFKPGGGLSRGTATTAVENLHRGGLVRREGVLTPVPAGWKTRHIDFGRGPRKAVTIPWGDVSTAFHSTGIPNVEVYLAAPTGVRVFLKVARPIAPVFRLGPVQSFLKRRIQAGAKGPTAEERARGRSLLWGEVQDATRTVVSRLQGPEGYDLTVLTALAALARILAGGVASGFQTPSRAFGPDFILEIPGTSRQDE
jgi:short subunit dehydrogenase-like uncharacterized protein